MKLNKTTSLLAVAAMAAVATIFILRESSEPTELAGAANYSRPETSATSVTSRPDYRTSTGALTEQEQVLLTELQQDFTQEELRSVFNPPTLEEWLQPTNSGDSDPFATASFQYDWEWAEFVDGLGLSPEDTRRVRDIWIESKARFYDLADALGRAVYGDNLHEEDSVLALMDAQAEVENQLVSRLSQILSSEQMTKYVDYEEQLIRDNLAFLETYQEEIIDKGHSGLISAADDNDLPTVQAYLASGADPNRLTMDGEGAIHEAARNNSTEILWALIDADADINLAAPRGRSALMKAALFGSTDAVRVLVEAGADVEYLRVPENPLSNALSSAARNGHTEIVRVLLDAGADATGIVGEAALVNAVEFGDREMERMLIEAGAPAGGSRVDRSRIFITLGRKLGLVD